MEYQILRFIKRETRFGIFTDGRTFMHLIFG